VILEEEPAIPSVPALPSAVLLALGLAERGPIADRTLTTAWDEYVRTFGGFTTWSDLAVAVYGFFYQGGSFAWIGRTCHFTDLTNPASYTATVGSKMLQTSSTGATPAQVGPGTAGPWAMTDGMHIDINIGAGAVAAAFHMTAADVTDSATYDIADLDGLTKIFGINGEIQTVVFSGSGSGALGAYTVADVISQLNGQLVGVSVVEAAGHAKIVTDRKGLGATIAVGAGTATDLTFGAVTPSTGNVDDNSAVTALEVEAVIEAEAGLVGAVDVEISGNTITRIHTIATGAGASIQVAGTSTIDFGLDHDPHVGAAATPEDTLLVEGKTPGSYTDAITTKVEAATNGAAASFNFKVLVNGAVRETFPNVTMDATSADWVETRVNHLTYGSDLVHVTDQLLAYSAVLKRPANGTSTALAGGGDGMVALADSDYLGNEVGPTGLYVFDTVHTGRILIVPGRATPAVHAGMITYAETHRNGSMFCVLDPPAQYTAAQMVTYVETTASLLESSEFAAIYWPRIKVSNPQPSVYGTGDTITIAPSGWIAGKYAANDQKLGGVYESPAGVGGSFGVIRGLMGVEDDPGGSSMHPVEKESTRDLIYPKRINPITRLPGTGWHIDGGRTLKSTGNFPNIGERRGVIFIEQAVASAMVYFKHRFNNRENRKRAERMIRAFLIREMGKGAFRSTNPTEAFFVDVSDQLNPTSAVFAGVLTVRIGLATNKPAEFIVILVTQDTRGLEESLAAA
jgi:hypothetical protein